MYPPACRLALLALAAATVCHAGPSGAGKPADPPSLLAGSASNPESAALISDLLLAPQPQTRAAAARVVHVARMAGLVARAREALGAESDLAAAREQIRVLASLGQASDFAEMYAAAERIPELAGPLSGIVAREKGTKALDLLEDAAFRNLPLSDADRARFLLLATREDGVQLGRVFSSALLHRDGPFWRAALKLAQDRHYSVDTSILTAALALPDPGLSIDTVWFLAAYLRERVMLHPKELLAALEEKHLLDPPPSAGPDEAMGYELLARVLGREPKPGERWIRYLDESIESRARMAEDHGTDLHTLLTPREIEALDNQQHRCEKSRGVGSLRSPENTSILGPALMRTASDLPPGMVGTTLRAVYCRPGKKGRSAVASVSYDPSGRPRVNRWFSQLSGACGRAAEILMGLALSPLDEVPREDPPHTVALLLDPYDDACAENETGSAPLVDTHEVCRDDPQAPDRVEPPVMLKSVSPRYPEEAKNSRLSGVVILETLITRGGCVRDVRVLRAPAYELALPSIEALMQWRFRPGKLGGRAIPVRFTISVKYNLTR